MRFQITLAVALALLVGGCGSSEGLRPVGEGGSGGAGGGTGGTGGTIPGQACGNGVLEADETCDGLDLAGATCQSLGFDGGTLGCGSTCSYITTACTRTEKCDNGIDDDGDGLIDCADSDCAGKPPCPHCGDGVRNGDESCDGRDLAGATCATSGFEVGEISCSTDCRLDTSACTWVENCSNGLDDDGNGLVDCADPACEGRAPCPYCGDGLVNVEGEACDGMALEASCSDFGFQLGDVACTDACELDLSGCGNPEDCSTPGDEDGDGLADCDDPDCAMAFACPECGNGVVQSGEACDGTVVAATCQDSGFDLGSVACTDGCMLDLSGCRNVACGDGVVEGIERCDDGNTDAGDGCSPNCEIEGDVCDAPVALSWDASAGVWMWEGHSSLYFSDYPAACGDTTNMPDMVGSFTAPAAGVYYASVQADFDAVLSVWSGTCGVDSAQTGCADDWFQRGTESLELTLAEGETVFLLVGESWPTSRGTSLGAPFRLEVGAVICGDGLRRGLEQCDDGNTIAGDGCGPTCRWEGDTCSDAFDLNQFGALQAGHGEWPDWTPPLLDRDSWQWSASTSQFSNDSTASSIASCSGGYGRDGVARFQAPYDGIFDFSVAASFSPVVYLQNVCGSASTPWGGCGSSASIRPRGFIQADFTLDLDMTVGQVVYIIVDGLTSVDEGFFVLNVSARRVCGNGVREFGEKCGDGGPVHVGCADCMLPEYGEREPNQTLSQATLLPAGQVGIGTLQASDSPFFPPHLSDIDMWSFVAVAGTTYDIRTAMSSNDCPSGGPDTYLRLYDVSGVILAENDDIDSSTPCSQLTWTAPVDGTYHVEVGLSSFSWPMMGPYYLTQVWMSQPEGQHAYLLFVDARDP